MFHLSFLLLSMEQLAKAVFRIFDISEYFIQLIMKMIKILKSLEQKWDFEFHHTSVLLLSQTC